MKTKQGLRMGEIHKSPISDRYVFQANEQRPIFDERLLREIANVIDELMKEERVAE